GKCDRERDLAADRSRRTRRTASLEAFSRICFRVLARRWGRALPSLRQNAQRRGFLRGEAISLLRPWPGYARASCRSSRREYARLAPPLRAQKARSIPEKILDKQYGRPRAWESRRWACR